MFFFGNYNCDFLSLSMSCFVMNTRMLNCLVSHGVSVLQLVRFSVKTAWLNTGAVKTSKNTCSSNVVTILSFAVQCRDDNSKVSVTNTGIKFSGFQVKFGFPQFGIFFPVWYIYRFFFYNFGVFFLTIWYIFYNLVYF